MHLKNSGLIPTDTYYTRVVIGNTRKDDLAKVAPHVIRHLFEAEQK